MTLTGLAVNNTTTSTNTKSNNIHNNTSGSNNCKTEATAVTIGTTKNRMLELLEKYREFNSKLLENCSCSLMPNKSSVYAQLESEYKTLFDHYNRQQMKQHSQQQQQQQHLHQSHPSVHQHIKMEGGVGGSHHVIQQQQQQQQNLLAPTSLGQPMFDSNLIAPSSSSSKSRLTNNLVGGIGGLADPSLISEYLKGIDLTNAAGVLSHHHHDSLSAVTGVQQSLSGGGGGGQQQHSHPPAAVTNNTLLNLQKVSQQNSNFFQSGHSNVPNILNRKSNARLLNNLDEATKQQIVSQLTGTDCEDLGISLSEAANALHFSGQQQSGQLMGQLDQQQHQQHPQHYQMNNSGNNNHAGSSSNGNFIMPSSNIYKRKNKLINQSQQQPQHCGSGLQQGNNGSFLSGYLDGGGAGPSHPSSSNTTTSSGLSLGEVTAQVYKCDENGCHFMASNRQNLTAHLRKYHSMTRPYKCTWPECKSTFKERYKLKVHQVVHTGEKPYVCTWPNCKSRFSQSGHLSRHRKGHLGLMQYRCTWENCNRTFLQKHSLKIHLMIHKGEKPWKCTLDKCERSFAEKWKLVKHLKTHKK